MSDRAIMRARESECWAEVVKQVTPMQKSAIGICLVSFGFIWFVLDFFWLPPLLGILLWLRLPESLLQNVWQAEFAMSATVAAVGVLIWRRAARKLSLTEYIVVPISASILVLAVFRLYGWI